MAAFSSNPFAALGDDDDQPKVQQKATPAAAPAAAKPAPRTIPGGARPAKKAAQDSELNAEVPAAGEGKEDRAKSFGGRGGARGGRGAGRGGRGGANPRSNGGTYLGGDRPRRENGGGRVFDRQSQTGHKDSEKAEAAGWGADEGKKELEAEVEGEKDAKTEVADGAATPARTPRVEEEEDNTQTYEQYLAAQAANKLNISLPEARVANDGAEDSKWAAVPVVKKAEQETEAWLANTKEKKAPAKKEKAAKQVLETEFSFAKPQSTDRPAGGRGGREGGRGRGGRGRGEGRGRGAARGTGAPRGAARTSAPAVNLADASAFPSL